MRLYFLEDNVIYEGVLLTRSLDGVINVAAMGYKKIDDSHVLITPYTNTKTYRNLTETRSGTLCIVDDVKLIADIVLKRVNVNSVIERVSGFPDLIVLGSKAALALNVEGKEVVGEKAEIKCRVDSVFTRGDFSPYSRVKPAIIEMLIYYTKINSYINSNRLHEALSFVDIVKHNFNIVRKIASGTVYEGIAESILNEVLKVVK